GNRDRLCQRIHRLVEALLDDRKAARRIAVVRHFADAQMVILENFESPLLLHAMVLALRAPAHHGLFIAPGGEREDAAFRPSALEPLVVDETVYRLQLGFEIFGE